MAAGWQRACVYAAVCVAQVVVGYDVAAAARAHELRTAGTGPPSSTNTACAVASRASESYVSAHPEATQVVVDAGVAYECLTSVPNRQKPALRLLNSLRTYLEFQSTKEYLRDPPSGYLLSRVDLDVGIDNIQKKVEQGKYDGEYDLQADIVGLLASAHDDNLYWSGDLMGAFTFQRPESLVTVSSDGEQTPRVYIASDLVFEDSQGREVPVTGYTQSPVESINGVDVVSFLLSQSMVASAHDPDALWNQLSPVLGRSLVSGTFTIPVMYPGPATNITFSNSTTREYRNIAVVNVDLAGVVDGDTAYTAFCPLAQQTTAASASGSAAPSSTTALDSPSSSPSSLGFAREVIRHAANSVVGYYLSEAGLNDAAVLQVSDFRRPAGYGEGYEHEFQMVVQKFLDAAVRTGKRKLVIDLHGNQGGIIDLGIELFAQLFPSIPPNTKSNMRDHLGLWILGNVASLNVTGTEGTTSADDEAAAENLYAPLAFQSIVDPEFRNFFDFQSFYGPQELHGGQFTSFFQNNYTNPASSDYRGHGLIITGTNNRTGFRQPFAPQDIVVLTDGICGGPCAVFSEMVKNYGNVQFIATGGRPQPGPMQGIGGVKGAQLFDGDMLADWIDLFQSPQDMLRDQANGTIWENFTDEAILRARAVGVNGRNHFRMGDESETPLQFVYEAADCRMWWTHEMLYDVSFLWARAARVAFKERRGTQFNSKYCVQNSRGHPTSISGGWKKGSLGPQEPPQNARGTLEGWKLDGSPLGPVSQAVNVELK